MSNSPRNVEYDWTSFALGLQDCLVELVGSACFTQIPFSPFHQGTNSIFFPAATWTMCADHIAAQLSGFTAGPGSSVLDSSTENQDWSHSLPSTLLLQDAMELDTATSRKRRRPSAPLDVSQVRRSVRATRYQSFKAPSMADSKKKISRVKPRCTPEVMMLEAQDPISSLSNETEVPPPTSIPMIQSMGTKLCGIPAEELTEDLLLADPRGAANTSSSSSQ